MGPLRVSNVLRPDNRVATGPCVGRGLFRLRPGAVAVRCSVCSLVLRWHILRTVGPEGLLWSAGSVGVRLVLGGASFARRSGPISGCGWGRWCAWLSVGACPVGVWEQWRGVFCARLWVYPVCYEVDSSPLFNFNHIFPPVPGACRNLAQKPLI